MNTSGVAKLFVIFQARYGYKWTSAYSDAEVAKTAVREWQRGLAEFPDDWIKCGLDTWVGSWPPSLPEFQAACLPEPEDTGFDIHNAAIRRAAGDKYNFDRMPANMANRAYDKAVTELLKEYQQDSIANPVALIGRDNVKRLS